MENKRNLLVCMDFSSAALHAMELAITYARVNSADIHMIYVIEPPVRFFNYFKKDKFTEIARGEASEALADLEARYEKEDANVTWEVQEGRPWSIILETAENRDSDMIFMGRSGQEALSEVILGSNTYRVAKNAPIPVMVIDEMDAFHVMEKVVVLVDPKLGITRIKRFLKQYANILSPKVDLVAVIHDKSEYEEDPEKAEKYKAEAKLQVENLKTYFKSEIEEIRKFGMDEVDYKIISGENYRKTVMEFLASQRKDADLVIISTDRKNDITDVFFGDLIGEIVSGVSIPVCSLRP